MVNTTKKENGVLIGVMAILIAGLFLSLTLGSDDKKITLDLEQFATDNLLSYDASTGLILGDGYNYTEGQTFDLYTLSINDNNEDEVINVSEYSKLIYEMDFSIVNDINTTITRYSELKFSLQNNISETNLTGMDNGVSFLLSDDGIEAQVFAQDTNSPISFNELVENDTYVVKYVIYESSDYVGLEVYRESDLSNKYTLTGTKAEMLGDYSLEEIKLGFEQYGLMDADLQFLIKEISVELY